MWDYVQVSIHPAICKTCIFPGDHGHGVLVGKRMKKIINVPASLCLRPSPFGPVAVLWRVYEGTPKICRVVLSRPGLSAGRIVETSLAAAAVSSCREIDAVCDQIEAFLHGDDIRFSLHAVMIEGCSMFQQKVLRAEFGIPRGFVSTYRRLAMHVGKPTGARAVGAALANNPFPIIIPCHRAIRTDWTLGGFQGGLEMKRALLEAEGLGFGEAGRVETEKVFY